MAMISCPSGHWYDNTDHTSCPYCNTGSIGSTVPVNPGISATLPVFPSGNPTPGSYGTYASDEGKTMPLIRENIGIDPVVGWLVCTNGKDRGKDYRIHADNNFIGRNSTMDICISGDETISRENHAIISYDSREKVFYLAPGSGRAIVRHNNKPALMAVELMPFDLIELGQTTLTFVPFCGEKFDWLDI
jgi:hypothetical protein